VVLAIVAGLVAALVIRQASTANAWRPIIIVAGVALGIRLLAVTVIYFIAIRTHGEGTWLNDEASFYLAAESLLPNPWDKNLPVGLSHLADNGYLGLLTIISVALGRMDTVAFRLTNALLGTFVAVLTSSVAARLVGRRAGLAAGLVVALWPTLILWSATFLRDTLGSFTVVAVWWTLVHYRRPSHPRVLAVVTLAIVLLAGLRPYLAGAVALGVLGWAVFPWLARQTRLTVALVAAVVVVGIAGVGVLEARHIDEGAHELVYRQMTTRMETLGQLYRDQPLNPSPSPQLSDPSFGPGAPVALVDPGSGWLLAGLVQKPVGHDVVEVAFTDGSRQTVPIDGLWHLQSAPLSPQQMLVNVGPGALAFFSGAGVDGDSSSLVWIAEALGWDVLLVLVLALVGGLRMRPPLREWLFPACVLLGTVAALVAVPGAPGNDDRHRASQTVPLLAVFAAGLLGSRSRPVPAPAWPVRTATSKPARAPAPATSRSRSLRALN